MSTTTKIVQHIPETLAGSPHPPFIGRERELAALDRMLQSALNGNGQLVLVEGENGIGKTRLLEELSELAGKRGFVVIRASGDLAFADHPLGPLTGLSVVATEPTPKTHGPASLEWMSVLVGTAPVLLMIDDAHWVDRASLYAIVELSRRHSGERLALVIGYARRPAPRHNDDLAEAFADEAPMRIRLSGLGDDVVTTLATEIFGAPLGAELQERLSEVGGNPWLCIELLRSLCAEHFLTVEDGLVQLSRGGLPHRTTAQLLRGVREFPPPTLNVLQVASVLGDRFRVAHLALVTDRPTAKLLPALDDAIRAGALDEDGDHLKFRHPLLRRALYDDIPTPIRSSLHLDVGRKLSSVGASPPEIGRHFALGALPGDPTAVTPLVRAAQEAAGRCPKVAVDLLRRALSVTPSTDPRRDTILAELITALVWCGRLPEAERLGRGAVARSRDLAATTALGLIDCLRGGEPRMLYAGGSAAACDGAPAGDVARASALAAWGRLLDGDLAGGYRAAREARTDGAGTTDGLVACAALGAEIVVDLARGRPRRALALAEKQLRYGNVADAGAVHLWPTHLFVAKAMRDLDRFDDAEAVLNAGAALAEELGIRLIMPFYQSELAEVYFHAGNCQAALHAARSAVDTADALEVSQLAMQARLRRVRILVHRNDLHSAHQELADAERRVTAGRQWPTEYALLCTRAEVAEADGELPQANALLEQTWQLCLDAGLVTNLIDLAPDAARLARAVDDGERAMEIARQLSGAVAGSAVATRPRTRCAVLSSRAYALDEPDLPRQAAEIARAVDRPWLRAKIYEQVAGGVVEPARRDETVKLLKDSLALYQRLEAGRDAARVKAALRQLGVRSRSSVGRATKDAARHRQLTSAELDVLGLLAQGKTNREVASQLYVSPRTVETHVSHMFLKLAVSSRTALVTAAAELGITKVAARRTKS